MILLCNLWRELFFKWQKLMDLCKSLTNYFGFSLQYRVATKDSLQHDQIIESQKQAFFSTNR